jgi:chromosome segregation ATPase
METRLKSQLDEIVEAAKLHKTIEKVDLSQSEGLIRNLQDLLKDRADIEDDDIASHDSIRKLEADYAKQMKEL